MPPVSGSCSILSFLIINSIAYIYTPLQNYRLCIRHLPLFLSQQSPILNSLSLFLAHTQLAHSSNRLLMGLTVSSENNRSSSATDRPTARVITPDGSLREFTSPVSASDPLVNYDKTYFLCNSDTLYFDSEITPVGPTELLQPGQLYFMLPVSMRGNVLSGIDMAALAVKASSALAQSSSNSRRRTSGGPRRARVAPDLVQLNEDKDGSKNAKLNQRINEDTVMVGGTRSTVAATAAVKAVKKGRTLGKKGTRALRRQLSIVMEAIE